MCHFDSRVEYRKFVVQLYERNLEVDGSDEFSVAKAVLANGEVLDGEVAMLTTAEPWADERLCPVEVLCKTGQPLDEDLISENRLWAAAVKALAADLRCVDTLEDGIWKESEGQPSWRGFLVLTVGERKIMEVKLKSAHAESFARIAGMVQGLKEAGIRGFVPVRADNHLLHASLRAAEQLEDRFSGEPIVDVDALVKLHALLRQLHRAIADGILDPHAVPMQLLEALSIVETHLRNAGAESSLDVPLCADTHRLTSPGPTRFGPCRPRRSRSG